ncbi:MFS transporter [Streptomyces sp. T21Q-yed]|uniref:MFS transporter n=1 Tax=Streptomyces sp. T12 TaxID=477697 RepID=UPI002366BF4B|nr:MULTISPECIES: MFS transporter [unclassified Streptomyces]MDF3140216.1 MFS transporter [Streptomyces sp. T21Q-yed]WDF44636.1 MFS transporter [Streptomyces sp. T12]
MTGLPPAFRWLLAGRTLSILGNTVAPIGLALAIIDAGGSAATIGIVVGARSAGNLLFVLAGGIFADRFPRSVVLEGSSAASAVTQGVVAWYVLSGGSSLAPLTLLALINGICAAFASPASSALLPQTVPSNMRPQANAAMRLTLNLCSVASGALAALFLLVAAPGWLIAFDALCFAVAGVLFSRVRVAGGTASKKESLMSQVRGGWAAFSEQKWLWQAIVGSTLMNLCFSGTIPVLGPILAEETFGSNLWGLVLGAQVGGLTVAAVLIMRSGRRISLRAGLLALPLGAALPLALGVYPTFALLLLAAFVGGLSMEVFGTVWETTLQDRIEPDKLGRVYSYDALGSFIGVPLGQVLVGPVSAELTPRATLVIAGVLMVGAALTIARALGGERATVKAA